MLLTMSRLQKTYTLPWRAAMPLAPAGLGVLFGLLLGLGALPAAAGGGGYAEFAQFWDPRGIDLPLAELVVGEITPFDRLRPLEAFVIYRLLHDQPFDAREREQILTCCAAEQAASEPTAFNAWREAHRVIPGSTDRPVLTYRIGVDHSWYANCLDDAFRTAARTLKAHVERWGAASDEAREWLAGQNQVFANCHEGRTIPEPLDASWDPRLRHDRVYQIAAAHLYADSWPEAERRFLDIASDPDSPWNLISGIVAARAMKRQGKLEAASDQLRRVLADPRSVTLHPAAEGLLRHIRYQVEPAAVHAETRAALLGPRLTADFHRVWTDYRWGLRAGLGTDHDLDFWTMLLASPVAKESGFAEHRIDTGFGEHHTLRERMYQAPEDRLWRTAALARAKPWHPKLDELLTAVDHIPTDAPEHAGALYHHVRLLIMTGRLDEARTRITTLRSRAEAWPLGARNRLRTLEAWLAEDVRGFVEIAHGEPVDMLDGGVDLSLEVYGSDPPSPLLLDVTWPLLQQLPIAALAALVTEARLSPISHKHALSVAFSRALIVGDHEQALALAPRVAEHLPALAGGARAYLKAPPDKRELAAALVLLESPSASPFFHHGDGILLYRNWWCEGLYRRTLEEPLQSLLSRAPMPQTEEDALAGMGTAPEHLAEIVFRWAEAHRDHPRMPEALHRVVVLTRRACGTRFGTISKHAFTLLHRRYPRSPWTEKTPYWFGD